MGSALFRKSENVKREASPRGGLSAFSRKLGAIAILALFAMGAETPDPYSIKMGKIESLLKCGERQVKRFAKTAEPYPETSPGKILIFKDPNLRQAVTQMRILAADLKKLSADMAKSPTRMQDGAKLLQTVSGRYLNSLSRAHVLYAAGAHAAGTDLGNFSFEALGPLNLVLAKNAAYPVFARYPFNVQHKSASELEFGLSDQERVLAEDAAVSSPKNEREYAKFLQHSVLREGFVNRWAVRRLTSQNFDPADEKVKYCGPELLSFRPGADKKIASSPLYKELVATDRFAEIRKLTPKFAEKSMNHPLGDKLLYATVLKAALGAEPNFKAFMAGASTAGIADWYLQAAGYVAANEQDDWQYTAQDVLLSATMPRDESAPAQVARRMAENAFERRSQAVREQIWMIATLPLTSDGKKIGVKNRDPMDERIVSELAKTKDAWISAQFDAFLPVAQKLEDPKSKAVTAYARREEKTRQIFEAAEPAIPAAYEVAFFEKAGMDYKTARWTEASKVKALVGGKLVAGMTLAPITPEDLELYFMGMMNSFEYAALEHVMNKQKEVADVISRFFKELGEEFGKEVAKTPDLVLTPDNTPLGRLAAEKAYAIQKELYAEYKKKHGKDYSMLEETIKIIPAKKDQLARPPKLVPKFDPSTADNKIVVVENGKLVAREKPLERRHPPMLMLQTPEEIERAKEEAEAKECGETPGLYDLLGTGTSKKPRKPPEYELIGDDSDQPMGKIEAVESIFAVMHLRTYNFDPNSVRTAALTKSARLMPYLFEHMTYAQAKFGLSFSQSALLQRQWRASNLPASEDERSTMHYLADAYDPSTYTVNKTKALAIIGDAIAAVRKDDKLEVFCQADTKTAAAFPDENFKQMFRASSATRAAINEKGQYDKYEENLRKLSRTPKEAFLEDVLFSHAMMWFFLVLMAISFFVMPLLSAGILAVVTPILTFINIAAFPIIIAGTYTRWSINYFEKPTQIKFQESVANSYLGDTRTMMGDLKQIASREKIGEEKSMLKFGQWTEPLWTTLDFVFGRAIVKDLRRGVGLTVMKSAKTLGLEARTFGKPPKQFKAVKSYNELVAEKGFVRGTSAKAGEFWDGMGRWLPKYQNFTMEEVVAALRGKVEKLLPANHVENIPELEQAIDYWKVRLTKAMKKLGDESPLKGSSLVKEGEPFIPIDPSGAEGFVKSPNLTLFVMYPKALIGAVKSGKILQFSKRWGEFVNTMRDMRVLYIRDRLAKLGTLIEKMELASKNGQSTAELVQSLSEEEMMLLYEAGRMTKLFGKGPLAERAAALFKPGPLRKLVPYFEAHEEIRMVMKPLQPGLKVLTAEEMKNYDPTHYYDPATDTYVPMSEEADMKAWYRSMEDFDGTALSSKEAEELRSRLNKRLGL